jgi:cobalt-zinc-cadmium efflux system membrane fusion protein
MTIIDDSTVFATANIYEKDLDGIKNGQQVRAKVASISDRTFIGKIAVIGSIVEGETRVVPVKAQLSNINGTLKPGMFAELEVMTTKADTTATVIPSSAIVDAEGKKLVYLQNGDSFQSVEVTLGQTSGDLVEVKSGLFEGDLVVTQRAPQLYAQSLRGGGKEEAASKPDGGADESKKSQESQSSSTTSEEQLPLWLLGATGGSVIGVSAFLAGGYFTSRSHRSRKKDKATSYETEIHLNNHHQNPTLSSSVNSAEEREEFQKPN